MCVLFCKGNYSMTKAPENSLKSKKSLGWLTFIFGIVTAAAFFVPYIVSGNGYFIFFGDFNVQQIPFYQHCHEMVRSGNCLSCANATIVYNPQWHKGVVGIVASRLVEAFYKPTIVFTMSQGGLVTGSARSVHGFDLYDAIESCADLLENFGGHLYAAGLTLKEENIPAFCERIEKAIRNGE